MEYDITIEKKEAKDGCLKMSKTSLFWLAILVLIGSLTALTVLMVKIDRDNKSIIESLFPLTMRTCEHNGQTYQDGVRFLIDSCNYCTCNNGQVSMCTWKRCFEDTPEPQKQTKAKEMDAGIRRTTTKFVEKGQTIELNCMDTSVGNMNYWHGNVDWYKDGSKLRSGGRRKETNLSAVNVLHRIMKVKGAVMADAGTYDCIFNKQYISRFKVIVLKKKTTSTELATSTTESPVLCPKGFFNKRNLCYFFSYKTETWSAAAQHCRDLDAYLAEPRTPWEVYFLKSLSSKRRRSVWLGATDQAVEGKWVWAQSGTDVDGLTDWYFGQPGVNVSGEDCMEINRDLRGMWNDAPCGQRKPFICQKETTAKNIGALQCLPPDNCLGSTKYLCIKCNTGRKRTKCNPIILDRFKTVMKTRPALTDSQVMSEGGEFSCLASVHEEAFEETPAYYIAVEFYNPNYIGTSKLMRLGKGDDDSFY